MKLGYTILYVRDVRRAVDFYEAAFALTRRFVHEGGQYAELDTGATTLAFAAIDQARGNGVPFEVLPADGPAPAVEVGFVTDDVPAAFERAIRAGAAAVVPPGAKPWGQVVGYVRDADGFLVELCTPVGGG